MSEYINLSEALKRAREICPNSEDDTAYNTLCDWLDSLPKVDAEPVIHAHWWLELEPNGNPYCFHCSNCDSDGHCIGITTAWDRCPHCGAKMDEEE